MSRGELMNDEEEMKLQFNRVMKVRVPAGLRSAMETAAHRDHSTVSDFIRRAVIDRLRAEGMPLNARPDARPQVCAEVSGTG